MKYVKMLGLAAVAAMALMAFVGAGSASASVLCKTAPNAAGECPTGWDYPAGTTVHITQKAGTTAALESGSTVLDTCTTSTFHGFTANTGSATETVHGENTLTWGTAATPCSKTTDTIAGGEVEIHAADDKGNGTVTAKNSEVTINTIFGTCVYGSGPSIDLGILTGGNTPTISIDATVPKISGNFACPSTSTWTAEYVVTQPQPLWVATKMD